MYSGPCAYAGRAVAVRAYADRIVLAVKGAAVAEHRREFGKGHYVLDPLHYIPLLSRKPGALRNGATFPGMGHARPPSSRMGSHASFSRLGIAKWQAFFRPLRNTVLKLSV
jgi:hypothetical protein